MLTWRILIKFGQNIPGINSNKTVSGNFYTRNILALAAPMGHIITHLAIFYCSNFTHGYLNNESKCRKSLELFFVDCCFTLYSYFNCSSAYVRYKINSLKWPSVVLAFTGSCHSRKQNITKINRGKQRWKLNKSKERERKLDKTSKRKYRGLNTKRKTKITHA